MAFTEFCCRSGGSNLNAGTRTGNSTEPGTAAALTYASGSWVSSTRVFTVASGDPVADGVVAGDWASVYADGSSVTGYIAQVTSRTTTTITLSSAILAGTAPANGTNTRTLKIGGAWLGPNAADGFPFNFINVSAANSAILIPRVNCKNDATYSITAVVQMTSTQNNGVRFEGYTSTYGDGGRAILDGGTAGASFILLELPSAGMAAAFVNWIFQNNGATGSADGVSCTTGGNSARQRFRNCVFRDLRGSGFSVSSGGSGQTFEECEFYRCNQSNTDGEAGCVPATDTLFRRCIFHDQAGSNNDNVRVTSATFIDCIFETAGRNGVRNTSNSINIRFYNCDFYANGADGFDSLHSAGNANHLLMENCNFIANGARGIDLTGGGRWMATLINCGFGTGTAANTSGNLNAPTAGFIEEIGSINYASNVTPWVDPANGDFRINLAAAQGTGRGTFTQTAASYTGAVAYPDVGAAQHVDAGGAAANTGIFQGINGQTGIGAF